MKKTIAALLAAFALPVFSYAQGVGVALTNLQNLILKISQIINILIPITFAIALLAFFYGLIRYILAAGSEEAKESGRRIMIGGIIALFVMSAIWGIVRLLANTVGVSTGGSADVPTVNTP
jgi:hypothetical protein